MRLVIMLLTAFFMSLAAPPAHADWSVKAMNKSIDQTNFLVNKNCSGTLFNAKEQLILTAAHCVEDQYVTEEHELVDNEGVVTKEKKRRLIDGTVTQFDFTDGDAVKTVSYKVKLEAVDKDVDLAVLKIKGYGSPWTKAVKFADSEPERGETIYVVGNPLGKLYTTVHKGIVSSMDRTNGLLDQEHPEQRIMQLSAGVIGGNSGGAVYNSEGEFIGVPVLASPKHSVLGWAVPLGVVKKFLADKHLDKAD